SGSSCRCSCCKICCEEKLAWKKSRAWQCGEGCCCARGGSARYAAEGLHVELWRSGDVYLLGAHGGHRRGAAVCDGRGAGRRSGQYQAGIAERDGRGASGPDAGDEVRRRGGRGGEQPCEPAVRAAVAGLAAV